MLVTAFVCLVVRLVVDEDVTSLRLVNAVVTASVVAGTCSV